MPTPHPHPCNFRLHRHLDRGWGEIAFEYRWDSTPEGEAPAAEGGLDLAHCHLYERTHYSGNRGQYADGWYYPEDPPFIGWKFRDPTDGRTGPVGLECFPASAGWAWDRHKIGGRIVVPTSDPEEHLILAMQTYRFYCDLCGMDEIVPGPDAGPHPILRSFRREEAGGPGGVWRYTITKHDRRAWMDLGPRGFIVDSAGLDYGPFWPDPPFPPRNAG
jgi:hypothetical protein